MSSDSSSSTFVNPLTHNNAHGKLLKCINNINSKLFAIARQNPVTDQTAHAPLGILLGLLPTISATHGRALEQGIDFLSLNDKEEVFELLLLADYLKQNLKTIKITNGTFIQQGVNVKIDFKNMMNSLGVVEEVNFGDAEPTRQHINKFIEDATNGGNKEAIPQGIINALTVMILNNCLLYEGEWVNKFPESRNGYFGCQNGNYKIVEVMMSAGEIDCRHHTIYKDGKDQDGNDIKIEDSECFEFPLANGHWFGVFFMNTDFDYEQPDDGYYYNEKGRRCKKEKKDEEPEVKKPELTLPPLVINEYIDKMVPDKYHVTMPMFQQKISLKLKDILILLGFTDIFSSETANLSGISDNKLFVQEILHDVNIKVDKKGVVASSSTTTFNGNEALKKSKKSVQINHTFYWWIRDEQFNVPSFSGIYDGK